VDSEPAGPLERRSPSVEAEWLQAAGCDQVWSAVRWMNHDRASRQFVESAAPEDPIVGTHEATAPR